MRARPVADFRDRHRAILLNTTRQGYDDAKRHEEFCYVVDGEHCPSAMVSKWRVGAQWAPCSCDKQSGACGVEGWAADC